MADNFLAGDQLPKSQPDPNDPNTLTDGDLSGASGRFKSEYGKDDANGAALTAYKNYRSQGQAHEQAYQSAVGSQGWSNGGGAPTSPVTATGGIPPPAPQPMPSPGTQDARTPAPTAAAPTYTAAHFNNTLTDTPISQFQAPDQSGINNQQSSLMSAILSNPQTMDANTVAQMKEQQKEQALLLGQQSAGQFAQGAVGRGTLNSGRTDAFRSNNDQNINNAILSGNRSTDLAAIAQNRKDQLDALTASSGIAQDQLGRASNSYTTGLTGQTALDASKLNHAGFGFQVDTGNANQQQLQYQSQKAANDAAFQRSLALAQNAQANYGQDVSAKLGFDASNLDVQRFLAQQQQFGDTLGFNYNQLDQNGNLQQQNNLLNAINGR